MQENQSIHSPAIDVWPHELPKQNIERQFTIETFNLKTEKLSQVEAGVEENRTHQNCHKI